VSIKKNNFLRFKVRKYFVQPKREVRARNCKIAGRTSKNF